MGEQGGEPEEQSQKVSTNYVNSKIVVTAVIMLLLGIIFILVLILFGMYASQNYREDKPAHSTSSPQKPADENVLVEYEEVTTNYAAAQDNPNGFVNSLMSKYGVNDAEYAIIRSNDELEDFVAAINSTNTSENATPFVYSVNSDFFATGTVVAVAKEDAGLDHMTIEEVYRDGDYNIHIIGNYSSSYDTTKVYGTLSLIQIQNIQPKTVDLVLRKEDSGGAVMKKPIIYLYPEKTTNVSVRLSNPERITVDYPDYREGWNVTAQPDGTLTTKEGKKLYALYYESQNIKQYNSDSLEEGFVVAKADVESFLDQKLMRLGLNYKEREEFISYWASVLEKKPYVFIRFQSAAEIEKNMSLTILPRPDTTIRIMMEYKPLEKQITVKEQALSQPERKGFTVVEWGGTEIRL